MPFHITTDSAHCRSCQWRREGIPARRMHLVKRLCDPRRAGDGEWAEDGVGAQPSFACSARQGRRPHMEDVLLASLRHGGHAQSLFGCFDGHCGKRAALHARDHLAAALARELATSTSIRDKLTRAFLATNEAFLELAQTQGLDDGCTALVVLLVEGHLWVANAGDSRAILCGRHAFTALTVDHTPEQPQERERIARAGGQVVNGRIQGRLATSRGFGDRELRHFVTACPDIEHRTLKRGDDFVVLATDGIWGALSNSEVCSLVLKENAALRAARKLTSEALRRGSTDNVCALVVVLRNLTGTSTARTPSVCSEPPAPSSAERSQRAAVGTGFLDEDAEDSDLEGLLRAAASGYCKFTKY